MNIIPNKLNSRPVFSYHTLLDSDMGILKYAVMNYKDDKAFDISKIKSLNYFQLIGEVYRRREENPLYIIMRDDSYKDYLDQKYNCLKDNELLIEDYLVYTEIVDYFNVLITRGDIKPSILYYTENEKKILDNIKEFKDLEKIYIKNIDISEYDALYLKYISEIKRFNKLTYTSVYLSNTGLNMNDSGDEFKESELINNLMDNKCIISIYELYKHDLIGNYKEGEQSNE